MRPSTQVLFAALLTPLLGHAEAAPSPVPALQDNGVLTLRDENDWWGGWSDKYYTNGSRIAWTSPVIDALGDAEESGRFTLSFTHEMYAPKNGAAPIPSESDHPYAGLAYLGAGLSRETADRLDSVQLDLGVVGPAAQAKHLQQSWHHLIDNPTLNGWDTQLHDEPLVNLTVERRRRILLAGAPGELGVDMIPRLVGIAGTARTEAVAGLQLRFGQNLPADFGRGMIRQNTAYIRPGDTDAGTSLYGYIDLQAEAVARNIALDGNLWHDSRAVGSRVAVGQLTLGLVCSTGRWRVELLQALRTEEFRGQDHVFAFGGISVSANF